METLKEIQQGGGGSRKGMLVTAAVVLAGGLLGLGAMFSDADEDAALDGRTLQTGTVSRGTLVQDVRAPGNLVPNQRRWLAARINARVLERVLEPGAEVEADSIIVRLASPALVQAYKQAQLALKVAETQLAALREQQKTAIAELEASVSLLEIEKQQAIADQQAKQGLRENRIIPEFQYTEAVLRREKLTRQLDIERFRLRQLPDLQASLLQVEQAKVEQQQLSVALLAEQVDRLNVRAGMRGILQSLAVEVGQQVAQGTELARVASQDNLKAQLRVQESQVKEIRVGQTVTVDTRRSRIAGVVSRIDPAVNNGTVTVDVSLPGPLPGEARPDLRVEGIVEIARRDGILIIDKPANWRPGTDYLYKLDGEHSAVRQPASFGLSAVSRVQLLGDFNAGDQIILSDLSAVSQQPVLAIE